MASGSSLRVSGRSIAIEVGVRKVVLPAKPVLLMQAALLYRHLEAPASFRAVKREESWLLQLLHSKPRL